MKSPKLYDQFAEYLRNGIMKKKFSVGEKIPSENEFHKNTQLSRTTIRRSISMLVEEGYLEKIQGKGTFVCRTEPLDKSLSRKNQTTFESFTEHVKKMGKNIDTKTVSIEYVLPSKQAQNFFKIQNNEGIIKITRIRYMNNIAFSVEETFFTNKFKFLTNEDLDGSLYKILENKYKIFPSLGEKIFGIVKAGISESFFLKIPRDTPLLLINDLVYDNFDKPLHISTQYVRADKFKYAIIKKI